MAFWKHVCTIWIFTSEICVGQNLHLGDCPSPKTFPDFEMSKHYGEWLEIYKNVNMFELDVKCTTITFWRDTAGDTNVKYSFRPGMFLPNGTLTTPNIEKPGRMVVDFPGNNGLYMPRNYFVLDTDYTTFSLLYSCSQFGWYYIDFLWIISRDKTFDPTIIEKAHSILKSNGIEINVLFDARGTKCSPK